MTIIEKINSDLKNALLAGNKEKLEILRFLKNALNNARIAFGHDLSIEETEKVMRAEAKKRAEAALQFRAGQRDDLADKEEQELALINSYLPELANQEETEKIVDQVMAELKPKNIRGLGQIINKVKVRLGSRADSSLIASIAKSKLSS